MNRNRSNELLGIILLALGVVMIFKAVFKVTLHLLFPGWWTLFIIVPCALNLKDHGKSAGNIAGLVIGGFLLLNSWGIFPLRIIGKILVPVLLLGFGIKLLSDGRKDNGGHGNDNNTISY